MTNANVDPNDTTPLFVPTHRVTTTTTLDGTPDSIETLYPPQGPEPTGTKPAAVAAMERGADASAAHGAGIEGENVVWEARYSMRNFIGRTALRTVATVAWLALAIYTWGYGHNNIVVLTGLVGVVVGVLWLQLIYRMAQAYYGHYYRLTNRRLFVSTGLMRRRRDQLELLRVKDVFTRQTLFERWLSLGTVIVVAHEKELPTFYLSGVNDPKQVMDLVWHHARAERDNRSTKVDAV